MTKSGPARKRTIPWAFSVGKIVVEVARSADVHREGEFATARQPRRKRSAMWSFGSLKQDCGAEERIAGCSIVRSGSVDAGDASRFDVEKLRNKDTQAREGLAMREFALSNRSVRDGWRDRDVRADAGQGRPMPALPRSWARIASKVLMKSGR